MARDNDAEQTTYRAGIIDHVFPDWILLRRCSESDRVRSSLLTMTLRSPAGYTSERYDNPDSHQLSSTLIAYVSLSVPDR